MRLSDMHTQNPRYRCWREPVPSTDVRKGARHRFQAGRQFEKKKFISSNDNQGWQQCQAATAGAVER